MEKYKRRIVHPVSVFLGRREKLKALMPQRSALLLPAKVEQSRNANVSQVFRQSSSLYYTTGFDEPDAFFVLRPGADHETLLFVHPKDPEYEVWEGFRHGLEGAKSEFAMDRTHLLSELDEKLAGYLRGIETLYYDWGVNPEFDRKIPTLIKEIKGLDKRFGRSCPAVKDAGELFSELRVIKDSTDISDLKRAAQCSMEAHRAMMRAARPGVTERHLQAVFYQKIFEHGANGHAYPPIIAGGGRATTLHYRDNDQVLTDGELVLIDAGAEFNFMASDITRTFPVSKTFSNVQAEIYDRVLDVQLKTIEKVRPGALYQSLRDFSTGLIVQHLIELGLLSGTPETIIANGEHTKYYPHGIGHFLGLDVHDLGRYLDVDGKSVRLQPGMYLTVEPGIYVPVDDESAPKEMRGIGIRIEDDVLVDETGHTVVTRELEKRRSEIEDLKSHSSS